VNFTKFVLSEFNVSLLCFKPFVQASKDIGNGILKVVILWLVSNSTVLVSSVKNIGVG
jgi:hypothetical protein